MSDNKPTETTETKSVLDSIYQDYGLLAQEQNPKKVADILRRIADGIENTGDIQLLGFTFGFTNEADAYPRAVIDIDFMEKKLISYLRDTAPEAPEKEKTN